IKLNLSQILHPSRSFVPFAVKKELNSDNLFENYGSETGFGLILPFYKAQFPHIRQGRYSIAPAFLLSPSP
ncbi:MAG: hypothetical protein PHS63_06505, partial [Desulfoplanes sp.]|nr:hypothetical protein [Desulfoplanes sp.]